MHTLPPFNPLLTPQDDYLLDVRLSVVNLLILRFFLDVSIKMRVCQIIRRSLCRSVCLLEKRSGRTICTINKLTSNLLNLKKNFTPPRSPLTPPLTLRVNFLVRFSKFDVNLPNPEMPQLSIHTLTTPLYPFNSFLVASMRLHT